MLSFVFGELFGQLDRLLLGGEALPAALVVSLFEAGVPEILNMYGPTETTVWSAVRRVRPGAVRIPIGRPIVNTDLFVLDGGLQPCSLGIVGELYIGGSGVARAYFRRPGLTAERFVPDGLSGRSGARLYRTGDLARWLPGGELEFVGRVDHQVKVRGHRIELGEIEGILASHPEVREAVVTAFVESTGASHLAAYFVPRDGSAPEARELRAFLGERLPEYMVPSVFRPLTALPLTPNGKIDRRALPQPGDSVTAGQGGFVAPRTPLEEDLAEIWRQVLETGQIGVHDDFFELGGHSLRAMQLIARLRQRFDLDLSIRELLNARTISGLAVVITQKKAQQVQSEEVLRILQELEEMSRDGAAPSHSSQPSAP